ncbi:eukaryotic translation initiation factor 5A, putative [Entamoeba invadens IP1]|uniref:Eukaryotic translation initiation factor 5A n=1 Tax=Entamoeba invadens IP1 TaxID=370355 RepID=A0A0A1U351_ENTIV|nr:eukaryotic translation initiation factor 5A, putative [Entamoeba invadens IP1]XP_004255264.1 eukaryotic translation initiation factor 5A, putative [Entamoeba invadens IP1]ELP88486.1 eukaryotic translation initiation factor 5A, putative [Entamoeba invadens IP1]ELP88493.1 eukaryotic translation initiation factor 5A, putative [Entamoeba invadens IP1]|eukprot:XP_004255257.1 eukaryotic translation initiation factor 5A, putative [Entamoeba invadens IP1]
MEAVECSEFQVFESNSKPYYPSKAGCLKVGGLVVIEKSPCKIISYNKTKVGKHGHAKVTLVGIDIFNGKRLVYGCPAHADVLVPIVTRSEYTIIDIEDGYLSLLGADGQTRNDLKMQSDECGKQIAMLMADKDSVVCVVQKYGDVEQVVEAKEDKL